MIVEFVVAATLSQIAGAPVFCHGGNASYYDPVARSIVLEQPVCDALADAPRMSRGSEAERRRIGRAIFFLAHEVAHVEQHRAQKSYGELAADCRAAATFGRYAYAVGVRGRAVMQYMVSHIWWYTGYEPWKTREAGCWGAWRP